MDDQIEKLEYLRKIQKTFLRKLSAPNAFEIPPRLLAQILLPSTSKERNGDDQAMIPRGRTSLPAINPSKLRFWTKPAYWLFFCGIPVSRMRDESPSAEIK